MPKNILRLKNSSRYYDDEKYLFDRVTRHFARRRTLCAFDFYMIIIWKSNRSITKVRSGLRADGRGPSRLMSDVFETRDDRAKMQLLDDIGGIGVPIASAILTVCYPDRFTVLDYRTWTTLQEFGRVPHDLTEPTSVDGYFDKYLCECERLAQEMGMSLRELDQAMWGWNKRSDMLAYFVRGDGNTGAAATPDSPKPRS